MMTTHDDEITPTGLPFPTPFILCSSFHSYRGRIGLIPSPLYPSCGVEPHTTIHVFSCSSHPTDAKSICSPCSHLFVWPPFFNVPPFSSPLSNPLLFTGKRAMGLCHRHDITLLWVGDRIHPPFSCVSYKATKNLSRCQHVYGVRLRRLPV